MVQIVYTSPIGLLYVKIDEEKIWGLSCLPYELPFLSSSEEKKWITSIRSQLEEYFFFGRRSFHLPLGLMGTSFQCRVWRELLNIPYGEHSTYGEVALRIGCKGAQRAVGKACGENPLLLLVPCHRVIRGDGGVGGFSAGVEKKIFLLKLESVQGRPYSRSTLQFAYPMKRLFCDEKVENK